MFNIFKNRKENNDKVLFSAKIDEPKENNLEEESSKTSKPEETWIWVEGYKGTDENMKCKDFQYELNKIFMCNEKIELCKKGFHFCEDLKDVFSYYNLDLHNRYFKIKGLVKNKDYNDMKKAKGKIKSGFFMEINDSKLTAKEIVFLEELKYKDLEQYIKLYLPLIKNEEEYINCECYNTLCKNNFLFKMKDLGFSNLFSQIQYDIINNTVKSEDHLIKYLKQAKAYKEENISKDLMIYLLNQYIDEIK